MDKTITDDDLMAFADGALDPERAQAVQRAVDADPELARRVAMFRDTAAALGDLGAAQPADIPDTILTRIQQLSAETEAAKIVNIASFREARRVPFWQVPLAASIFLALGVTGALLVRPSGPEAVPGQLAALDAAPVLTALEDLPSGEERELAEAGRIAMIASFSNDAGEFCREFEYDPPAGRTVVSVSCHDGADWGLRLAVMAAPVDAGGYAPASSLDTLDAYLTVIGAGAPMSADEEEAALRRLP